MTGKRQWWIAGLVVLGLLLAWVMVRHTKTEADDEKPGEGTSAEPVAAVVKVERRNLGVALTLAGAFKPFQDVDIHAKVAGYIKVIYVDVGSHVKEGQTLAILEVPELQAQLAGADAAVRRAKEEIRRAEGDLTRAKSSYTAAHAMYDRLSQAAQQRPDWWRSRTLTTPRRRTSGGKRRWRARRQPWTQQNKHYKWRRQRKSSTPPYPTTQKSPRRSRGL